MSRRCDDNFTSNYTPSHSSPFDKAATDEVEDFTPVRAELCCSHPSFFAFRQIELCLLFHNLSFNNCFSEGF